MRREGWGPMLRAGDSEGLLFPRDRSCLLLPMALKAAMMCDAPGDAKGEDTWVSWVKEQQRQLPAPACTCLHQECAHQ